VFVIRPPAWTLVAKVMAQSAVRKNFLIIVSILTVSGCKGSNKTAENRKNDEKIT
jgi:hypothetical protein